MSRAEHCGNCSRKRTEVHLTPCPCDTVAYCSKACQDEHIPVHEKSCAIRHLQPQLQHRPPEVVAELLRSLPPQQAHLNQQRGQGQQHQDPRSAGGMPQQQPQQQQQQRKRVSTNLSSAAHTLLNNATREQLMALLGDICGTVPGGADMLDTCVKKLKMQSSPLPHVGLGLDSQMLDATQLQLSQLLQAQQQQQQQQKGATPQQQQQLLQQQILQQQQLLQQQKQLQQQQMKDQGKDASWGATDQKAGGWGAVAAGLPDGKDAKPGELPAFFSGVAAPGACLESLEPDGATTLEEGLEDGFGKPSGGGAQGGSSGSAMERVQEFLKHVRTANLEPSELAEWKEQDLQEFAEMFMISGDKLGDIWMWIQDNKSKF